MPDKNLPNIPPDNGSNAPSVHNFNVTLSEEAFQQLTDVAKLQGLAKVQVLRALIRSAHLMYVHNVPVCVTGGRCFSPQMHPPPQAAPHQTLISNP